MSKPDKRFMVSVYGNGISKPLLQTNDARLIQIRDSDGELMSMFVKLTDALWGFTTRGDSDWESHKRNAGIEE